MVFLQSQSSPGPLVLCRIHPKQGFGGCTYSWWVSVLPTVGGGQCRHRSTMVRHVLQGVGLRVRTTKKEFEYVLTVSLPLHVYSFDSESKWVSHLPTQGECVSRRSRSLGRVEPEGAGGDTDVQVKTRMTYHRSCGPRRA